jgi:hypothetical protein
VGDGVGCGVELSVVDAVIDGVRVCEAPGVRVIGGVGAALDVGELDRLTDAVLVALGGGWHRPVCGWHVQSDGVHVTSM